MKRADNYIVTKEDLETDIKSLIKTVAKTCNDNDIQKEEKERYVDGILAIISSTLVSIKEKHNNYPLEKKLKKYHNMLYQKLDGGNEQRI